MKVKARKSSASKCRQYSKDHERALRGRGGRGGYLGKSVIGRGGRGEASKNMSEGGEEGDEAGEILSG